jgi:MoaA/NifB/PqqE/SkfB family radical SAM enzyme
MILKPHEAKTMFPSYAGDPMMMQTDTPFEIYWTPDTFCNYKCSYCWPGSNSPDRHHLPEDIMKQGMNDLIIKIKDLGIKNINLAWAGGEPTLVPWFTEMNKIFADDKEIKKSWIGISTNLTHGKRWWSKWLDAIENVQSASISASWHRESVGDIEDARQRFVDVHKLIMSRGDGWGRWLGITMVMPPEQFDAIYEDALFFRDHNINVLLRVARKHIGGKMLQMPGYTDEMIEKIVNWNPNKAKPSIQEGKIGFIHKDKSGIEKYADVEHPIALGKTDYLNWKCFAGVTSVVIYPNGDIKRGHGCRDKILGNIKDSSYQLHSFPEPCITARCGCSADMRQLKVL